MPWGYALYQALRARHGDALADDSRWLIIASTAVGALLGSRILGLLEQAPRIGLHWRALQDWLYGLLPCFSDAAGR